MKFSYLLLIISMFSVFSGCHYKISKDSAVVDDGNVGAGQVDFAIVMSEVIAPKCLECHSSAGGNRGGVNLETYANVKAEIAAIQSTVANNSMPLNRQPLSARQKALLNKWIEAGAPETVTENPPVQAPTPAPPPDMPPEEVVGPSLDWLTVRTLVVEPKCLNCHSAPTNRGGVNLETYQNVLSNIADVDATIRDGSMPRRTTLTPEQKKLILDWIAAGAPEFSQRKP
ncbi:hypothetical protein AZI85_01875 [Bdellovibrio bacteriovorus]|uniref:Cytochrome c domain-containing protein n=1 Tax=Bdellovibrio bacteriovorus TaxID=959 RepID=A0A150WW95_BDEBC|nr:hypothetical protein [Bdellovibrio bacteriovorus]KYG70704.1 hypothetical protein AZI85_01875 [Bdellovibrio bacteriovorus]